MSQLKNLSFTNNQITSIPEDIGKLSLLDELHLGKNEICTLPNSLNQLKKLREFWIYGNCLSELSNIGPASFPKIRETCNI